LIVIALGSCKDNLKTNTKKNMVGKYDVHLELNEKTFDKQGVKDSVTEALSKAKEELSKMKMDFDEKMDTSTAEGKMEYYAKSFAKTMASFGKDLGELGILMGQAAGDVAVKAMDMTEDLVQHIKMDVELKENGQMITNSNLIYKVQFSGSHWEVNNDIFTFKDDEGHAKHEYKIVDKTDNGFVLVHEKYRLIFVKKAN
jgi:hypothetical protein